MRFTHENPFIDHRFVAILIDFGLIVPDGDKQLSFMDGQDVTEDDLVPWHMVITAGFFAITLTRHGEWVYVYYTYP